MPVHGYEFQTSSVQLNISLVRCTHSWDIDRVEHEEIKFIFTSGHVIFYILYQHWWKRHDFLCNHNEGDLFTCEDIPLTNRVRGPYRKLRTEFFPPRFMAQARSAGAINRRGKKRGFVTYSTDRENEVSKIFIISLVRVWGAQEF